MDAQDRLDLIADASFSADLESLTTDELRRRRRLCEDEERRISYRRRLVHARLDLIAYEQRRRRGEEVRPLLEAIDELLADRAGSAGGHLTASTSDTSAFDDDLPGGLDFVAGSGERSDAELEEIATQLSELERDLSSTRRLIHETEARLGEELRQRYRSGAASVDELLPE